MSEPAKPVVLASGSRIRQTLLRNAGVQFIADPANVDEATLKTKLRGDKVAVEVAALELAGAKAQSIAGKHPGALVIGADQMLECDGTWFDKPRDLTAAAEQLMALAGRKHRLINGLVVLENGAEVWRHADSVGLFMRPFSAALTAQYLKQVGPAALQSVGGYQLEGLGAQLFERIDGDYFSVLGLPLLPLLAFLRRRGVIPE